MRKWLEKPKPRFSPSGGHLTNPDTLGIGNQKWSMCMVFMIFYSSVAAQASSFAGWMIRVVFRATFTLSSLLRASPVFCLSTKCSIRCSSYSSSWQHRQQKLHSGRREQQKQQRDLQDEQQGRLH